MKGTEVVSKHFVFLTMIDAPLVRLICLVLFLLQLFTFSNSFMIDHATFIIFEYQLLCVHFESPTKIYNVKPSPCSEEYLNNT